MVQTAKKKDGFLQNHPFISFFATNLLCSNRSSSLLDTCLLTSELAQVVQLGAADILSVTNKYTYDGTAKTPTPVVKMRGTNITAGTDFDFAYANNTNAGWAVVKVIAKKFDYYGGQSSKFYIAPKTLTSSMVSNIVDQSYTGSPVCPMPVVVDGSTALAPVKDFAVFWSNNIRATTNAVCRIVGNGNYTGAVDTTFKIVEE